jgi:hypothetical protein
MRLLLRVVLGLLLALLLALLGVYLLVVNTDLLAGRTAAAFNRDPGPLRLELGRLRLGWDLLSTRGAALRLADSRTGAELVGVDRLDLALGGLPWGGDLDLDHLDLRGVRVSLDRRVLEDLQRASRLREASPAERQPAAPGPPRRVRLGRVSLRDVALHLDTGAGRLELPRLDVRLSGEAGPLTRLNLALEAPGGEMRLGERAVAWRGLELGADLSLSSQPPAGTLKLRSLEADLLTLGGVALEGLQVGGLSAGFEGLGASLEMSRAHLERATLGEWVIRSADLSLKASGAMTRFALERLDLTSRDAEIHARGTAELSLGLLSRSLKWQLAGTFSLAAGTLAPRACEGVAWLEGTWAASGDLLGGPPQLDRLDVAGHPGASLTGRRIVDASTAIPGVLAGACAAIRAEGAAPDAAPPAGGGPAGP